MSSVPKKPMRPLTAYHIFFKIEREYVIQTTAGEDADKCIHDGKVYLSDVPQRYRNIMLLPDWYAGPGKRQKRKHRKQHGKIGFHELSRVVSTRWAQLERVDPETKAFVQKIAKQKLDEYYQEMEAYKEATKGMLPEEVMRRTTASQQPVAATKKSAKKRHSSQISPSAMQQQQRQWHQQGQQQMIPRPRPSSRRVQSRSSTRTTGIEVKAYKEATKGMLPEEFVRRMTKTAKKVYKEVTDSMPPEEFVRKMTASQRPAAPTKKSAKKRPSSQISPSAMQQQQQRQQQMPLMPSLGRDADFTSPMSLDSIQVGPVNFAADPCSGQLQRNIEKATTGMLPMEFVKRMTKTAKKLYKEATKGMLPEEFARRMTPSQLSAAPTKTSAKKCPGSQISPSAMQQQQQHQQQQMPLMPSLCRDVDFTSPMSPDSVQAGSVDFAADPCSNQPQRDIGKFLSFIDSSTQHLPPSSLGGAGDQPAMVAENPIPRTTTFQRQDSDPTIFQSFDCLLGGSDCVEKSRKKQRMAGKAACVSAPLTVEVDICDDEIFQLWKAHNSDI